MSKVYHCCIVSHCTNTSVKTPEKVFIQVPSQKNIRHLWLQAVGRNIEDYSERTCLFVCEDHFELPSDMENYLKWKITGCNKKMKKHVVPHKYLQPIIKVASLPKDVSEEILAKRIRLELIDQPSVSRITESTSEQFRLPETAIAYKDVAVSAKPNFHSRAAIQTVPQVTDQKYSPVKFHINPVKAISSSIKNVLQLEGCLPSLVCHPTDTTDMSSTGSGFIKCNTPYYPSHSEALEEENAAKLAEQITFRNIFLNPKIYLGISKDSLWIIDELEKHSGQSRQSIYLTLKKIKTDHTFAELCDDFGIDEGTATSIFKNAVPLLGHLMRELIVWHSTEKIESQLSTAFRARYSKVQSIIDCLEIEINRPSDAKKQALTWCKYKKAYTIKYLISATPDGFITFISKGYGGRVTDEVIVKNCGYLDNLTPGMVIMVDRGFKNIDKYLQEKQCSLVRPPSVGTPQKLIKEEVDATKRIASSRFHVERVSRRLREFKFLRPHACIHSKLIAYADHIVYIACGLINLQNPLIKH